MSKEEIIFLLKKYCEGQCSEEEKALVESWYNHKARKNHRLGIKEDLEDVLLGIWGEVLSETETTPVLPQRRFLMSRYAAAVVALCILMAGIIYYSHVFKSTDDVSTQIDRANTDVAPGRNGATLTLSDGRRIKLRDASRGAVIEETGVRVSIATDGQVVYEFLGDNGGADNTLSTERGETYALILPDGTHVWLNAASSLTYSTSRKTPIRQVSLQGEAYFEVAEDKKRPFIVKSGGQTVRVLGTHFNVSNYDDESRVTTTLLKGSVRVSGEDPKNTVVLKPDQQAEFDGTKFYVSPIIAQSAISWKDGKFVFASEEIASILRRIARWYNVDIRVDSKVGAVKLSGSVSRFENLSTLLEKLEQTGQVRFDLKGKTLSVYRPQ